MDAWVVWTLVACALAVGEMLTMGFFLAPFAGGGVAAAIASLIGAGTTGALIVFVVVSLGLFLGIRPLARRHRRLPPRLRTGTAGLIGQRALVVERIANAEAVGCVKIDGEVWTARAYDDDEVMEVGERVHVIEIRGATALVGS
ncbi:MAG: NfeD family protein [Actinobacteria bacterium]|nr:MAG: NfeD family protein [Actinomycetota bacterium]